MNKNNIDKLREEAAAAAGTVAYMLEPFDIASDNDDVRDVHQTLREMVRCGAKMAYADCVEQVQAADQKFIARLKKMYPPYIEGANFGAGYFAAIDDILQIFKEM
jgi:hypothetical protein